MKGPSKGIFSKAEGSLILVILGVAALFFLAIGATLIAPNFVDPSWVNPCSSYQMQMYEVSDPNIFLNAAHPGTDSLQYVQRLKKEFTLLSFEESEFMRVIFEDPELEKFVTKYKETPLKLTSQLLLLRKVTDDNPVLYTKAQDLQLKLQEEWMKSHPDETVKPFFTLYEIYAPSGIECFAVSETDGIVNCWAPDDYLILDQVPLAKHHQEEGVIYVKNPQEFRVSLLRTGISQTYQYDPNGKRVENIQELTGKELGFVSRAALIQMGEDIFKKEGCWYCHTDQSRTLVQDSVANGSDSYPDPHSCANEYIYQEVTFPGTRRIGPDLARVGVKRPSRDWHKAHFWAPKTKSKGSIMPSFRHFFDEDSSGISKDPYGVPNIQFEAIYQYLMTKGTRLTAPNQSWWLGLDTAQTEKILDGKKNDR